MGSSTNRSGTTGNPNFIGASGQNNANLLGGVMAGQTSTNGSMSGAGMNGSMNRSGSMGMNGSMNRNGMGGGMMGQGGMLGSTGGMGNNQYGAGSTNGFATPSVAKNVVIDFEIPKPVMATISTDLSQRFAEMPGLRTKSPLTVAIQGDTAILRGVVATQHDREMAERILLLEPRISKVSNELAVTEPGPREPVKVTHKAVSRHLAPATPTDKPAATSAP
jgi:hypothetical protein